jgi:iron complex transport system ATP-binding protein
MFSVGQTEQRVSAQFQLSCLPQTLSAGQVVAVLGSNGAGKSSLLSCWAEGGTKAAPIRWHGHLLAQLGRQRQAIERSYLMQQQSLNFPLRCLDLVAMGAAPWALPGQDLTPICLRTMKAFACLEHQDQVYTKLSGGQQQRVQLARVFLQVAEAKHGGLIFLDEPTSAQDLAHQHQIYQQIAREAEAKQALILVSMHDLNHALKYADHCLVLAQGELVASGPPRTVLTPAFVRQHWHFEPSMVDWQGARYLF